MMSAKMVALTFAFLASAAAQPTCQGAGCKVDVPEDELSLIQMKMETEVPPKVQKLQQEWEDFKADMNETMAVAKKKTSCYGLPALSCQGGEPCPAGTCTGKVPPEKCSSAYDYGWCNGCGCKHCRSPASATEACAGYDPHTFCVAGEEGSTKHRKTDRGGNWCDCCDIMWEICVNGGTGAAENNKYKAYLDKYQGGGKDKAGGINKVTDYSQGHGNCKAGNERPHWEDGKKFTLFK